MQRSLIVLQHWTKQMLFWQNASFQAENEECVTLKYQAHQQQQLHVSHKNGENPANAVFIMTLLH